ncbi:MAG: ABC transporter ATP-binding protein [Firmicutes bacterium]|nr:ABC transporter ATP-binding protein [Bacillota bacterium]
MRGRQKPKNTKATIKRILSYFGEYKLQMVLVIICIIVSAGASIAGTYMLKPVVNDYIVPFIGKETVDVSGLLNMLKIMGITYLAGALATYTYNRIMIKVSTGILLKIRKQMFTHMQELPIRYFDSRTHGEIMSRYTNDTDTMREMLSQSLPAMFFSALNVTGVFVMMIIMSPILTLLVVAMLFIMMQVIKKVGGKSAHYFVEQQKALGKVNGYSEEMIEGQKVVKVFCHESAVKNQFNELNADLATAASKAHTFANILMPIMGNLSHLHFSITAMVGALLAVNGMLDVGTLGSFLQYTRNFAMPITQASQQFNAILTALAGAERIFALLDERPEEDEGKVTLVHANIDKDGNILESDKKTGRWAWKEPQADGSAIYTELRGDVRFNDVTFGYEENKVILHDISLFAKPGQKIAFVGSTGAGKTTITNLINRFYDIQEGSILYDGIDVRNIKKDDLRRSLGMVLQDTHLFSGTVMENIRYGDLSASDEDVIRAAKLANADAFIRMLPQGYDTEIVADGANLSQGQRQLLAIARAAVADPPVLILDEATSSIDTRTEALIERGMDELMRGRTVFVIAHRLSTVRNSNAIMVLEQGKIIERGDHDDLLAEKGRYYQLYTGMFELS